MVTSLQTPLRISASVYLIVSENGEPSLYAGYNSYFLKREGSIVF